jgi:hypothetical protein
MKLTKENLPEWKKEVNKLMTEKTGFVGDWCDCCHDNEWLADWEDEEPEDYVIEEISNFEA